MAKSSGKSAGVQDIENWSRLRKAALDRDGWCCRICGGGVDEDRKLNVHHVDWDRSHNEETNLVTLCQVCHQAVHREGYKPELYEDWPVPWEARGSWEGPDKTRGNKVQRQREQRENAARKGKVLQGRDDL